MIGSFEFKNIESKTYKLVCKSVKRPLLPAMRPRTTGIYGKSGIIDYGENDYDTRPIAMHIAYIGESYIELRSRAREIAAWLSTASWAKLIINDEPDKYYLAKVIDGIDLDTLGRLGEADIIFECQPFAYMVVSTDDDLTWDEADLPWVTEIPWEMSLAYTFTAIESTSFAFDNPGTKEINSSSPQGSKFDIVITGTWTSLSVALNGKTLDFVDAASGTLIINNIDMEVTLDSVNRVDAIDGDIDSFLCIMPGENTIAINGTDLNVTVALAFAPMWL